MQSFSEPEPIGIIDDGVRFFIQHFYESDECIKKIRDDRSRENGMNGMTMIASASLNSDCFFFAIRKNDGTFIMSKKDQFTVSTARAMGMEDKILAGINNIFIKLLI